MNKSYLVFLAVLGAFSFSPLVAAQTDDSKALREEFAKLKEAYEKRIAALENKQVDGQKSDMSEKNYSNAFNPQISLILDGVYSGGKNSHSQLFESIDGINHAHAHDEHAHGEMENGFNLRETELAFSSTVSPYFDASTYLSISKTGGVSVEEAYFDTRALPAGLKIRAGKFLSGIGYLNSQHPHQWDFVDQNLPYQTLIGEHGLADTGLRLTWLPKTGSWYTQLSVELLQGQEQTFASSDVTLPSVRADGAALSVGSAGALKEKKNGPRLTTLYAKFAPDLGANHALQLGTSYAFSSQHQEVHDHSAEETDALVSALEGKGKLWGLDAVYKYDTGRFGGEGNFKLVAEYLRLNKDLKIAFSENADLLGEKRNFIQDGYVLQGSYGILPKWQMSLRYDLTGLTNQVKNDSSTLWKNNKSSRITGALSFLPNEFSLFRLQVADAKLSVEGEYKKAKQIFLQYQHSLGAHGAHTF